YHYELVKTADAEGYHAFTIDLTSQTWLTDKEGDRTVWKHWPPIVAPKEVRSATGLLLIGGGANGREAPSKVDGKLLQIALSTKSVVAELRMVPNQPLTFGGAGQ